MKTLKKKTFHYYMVTYFFTYYFVCERKLNVKNAEMKE